MIEWFSIWYMIPCFVLQVKFTANIGMTSEVPVPPEYIAVTRNIMQEILKLQQGTSGWIQLLKDIWKVFSLQRLNSRHKTFAQTKNHPFEWTISMTFKKEILFRETKKELEDRCPLLLQAIYVAGCNESQVKVNKIKTSQHWLKD